MKSPNLDFKTLQAKLKSLDEVLYNTIVTNPDERELIYDGAIDLERYCASPIKIMWLMKEAYDTDGGNWYFSDFFKDGRYPTELIHNGSKKTWHPVTYAVYGILNKLADWDAIPDISDEPEMVDILRQIAWVNIQKLPSITGTQTSMQNIHTAFEQYIDLLSQQIELLSPDIIICGGTGDVVAEHYNWTYLGGNEIADFGISEKGQKLIYTKHPAARINPKDYVNGIIDAANRLLELQVETA